MSINFQTAQKILEEASKKGYPPLPEDVIPELKKSYLPEGDFVVDTYCRSSNRENLLGMVIRRGDLTNEKIEEFAKKENLIVGYGSTTVYLRIKDKDLKKRKELGRIENNRFLATTPELFKKIGEELYKLSTTRSG